jgi:hypothetical protein
MFLFLPCSFCPGATPFNKPANPGRKRKDVGSPSDSCVAQPEPLPFSTPADGFTGSYAELLLPFSDYQPRFRVQPKRMCRDRPSAPVSRNVMSLFDIISELKEEDSIAADPH